MALRDSQAHTNGISAAWCNLVSAKQPESLKLRGIQTLPRGFGISCGLLLLLLLGPLLRKTGKLGASCATQKYQDVLAFCQTRPEKDSNMPHYQNPCVVTQP